MNDNKTLSIMGIADLSKSNHELGEWLVVSWIGFHAAKAEIPLDKIPEEWAIALIDSSAKMDSESVENAALESAFRKACTGKYESAGKILRDYIQRGAESMIAMKYARKGLQRKAINSKAGKATAEIKKTEADAWHGTAIDMAQKLIASGKKPHEVTGIVAKRLHRPPQKIRPVLQAANVVSKKKKNLR